MNIVVKKKLHKFNRPLVMGILNCTVDSFFDGGKYLSESDILKRVETMLSEGADIIDIGAVSTRPGAKLIPVEEEISKIQPIVKQINKHFPTAIISVDTCFSEVAKICISEGADIINDISGGLFDENMFSTVAELQVPYVLTHNRTTPDLMSQQTDYNNITHDVINFFSKQLKRLYLLGAKDIILDLGFGFAKTVEQNYELLKNIDAFSVFEEPLLVGISRKSMIYKILNTTPQTSLNGTSVLNTFSLLHGANILRVHDVAEAVECIKLTSLLK